MIIKNYSENPRDPPVITHNIHSENKPVESKSVVTLKSPRKGYKR